MYQPLVHTIKAILNTEELRTERKNILSNLINYIQEQVNLKQQVNLNFICTHNSRRSHLTQIWAQVAARYYNHRNIHCYSGGTEVSAMHPTIVKVLMDQGLVVLKISQGANPIFAIKYGPRDLPVVGFSKMYDDPFNPESGFAAVLTCEAAALDCPFVLGADVRIPIPYRDPKVSDGGDNQEAVYLDSSLEIAREMLYVFSKLNQ